MVLLHFIIFSRLRSRSVNPLYYVTFTTFTLIASFILFQGFNTVDASNTISLLCGFLTIFAGVYLLNLSREDPNGEKLGINSRSREEARGRYSEVDGIPTDGLAGLQTRLSMQSRRSGDDGHRRSNSWGMRSPAVHSKGSRATSGEHMMHSYDVEANNLADLAEDSDEDNGPNKRTSFGDGRRGLMNGSNGKIRA
jgi:hypothetical protein